MEAAITIGVAVAVFIAIVIIAAPPFVPPSLDDE